MKIIPKLGWKQKCIVFLITIIIFGGGLFYFYVNYNLVVIEELNIRLTPGYESIELVQGEAETVEFVSLVSNHWLCNSECKVNLKSISSGNILFEEEFLVDTTKRHTKTFEFTPHRYGEGQELYTYTLECKNIATNICVSGEREIKRTGVVAINFELDEDGLANREFLREGFEEVILILEEEARALDFARYYENVSFLGIDFVVNKSEELLELVDFTSEMIMLWQDQNFESVIIPEVTLDVAEKKTSIIELVEDYNLLVENYNNLNLSRVFEESRVQGQTQKREELRNQALILEEDFKEKISIDIIRNRYERLELLIEEVLNEQESLIVDFEIALQSTCSDRPCELEIENICANIELIIFDVQNKSFNEALYDSILVFTNEKYDLEKTNRMSENKSFNEALFESNLTTGIPLSIFENLELISESCNQVIEFEQETIATIEVYESEVELDLELGEPKKICCFEGECKQCCQAGECLDNKPLLLIHGHGFGTRNSAEYSTDSFNRLKDYLKSKGYVPGQIISVGQETHSQGDLGRINNSFVFKSTYYSITFFDEFGYITSLSKTENIDTYAVRLKNMIDYTLEVTGKEQVDIIAHSMGGLVTRRYMQIFGDELLGEVIIIGTPNKGISERVYNYCRLFGLNKECEDMRASSVFMRNLNDPRNAHPPNRIHVIRAVGCDMPEGDGDGVIPETSVMLENQHNYLVSGECFGTLTLHTRMLDPNYSTEVKNIITSVLNND